MEAPLITADDLERAVGLVGDTLRPTTDRDWTQAPGTGDWDCWHTAEHIGDGLLSYAAQLVALPTTHYVRFLAVADKDATAAELLEFAMTGCGLLVSAVRTAAPSVRAYHPSGMADPAGFAAMGCVEALVHAADMARGLGVEFEPPRELCARVLARLFPHHPDLADVDPWLVLLWATNRHQLPGREPQTTWRWRGTPPGE